jgi:structural maintenance of chromosome 3 (chondroitin sulfate proteoglycan 6)
LYLPLEFSDAKRSKIDELLKYIQEKLGELEEEKDELDQYQTLDRERRSLEYTIYARELADANRKLEELEENRARDVETSAIKQQQLADNETSLSVSYNLPFELAIYPEIAAINNH